MPSRRRNNPTPSHPLYPIADGPLRGESHNQGSSFYFEGELVGLENGTYRLVEGLYRWEAGPDVIPLHRGDGEG